MIQIVFFIICLVASLYILYLLTKHDFVLARKSLLLQEIFDVTFVGFLAFLITARTLYIVSVLNFNLLNPLKFFHIFKFPGALFLGGLLGFWIVIYFFFKKKKILARLYDIYALSLFPLFIFALGVSYNKGYFLYFNILVFFLSILFMIIGIYSYKNYSLKDGSIAFLFVCLITVFTIISEFSSSSRVIFSYFTIPQIISVIVFLGFSVLLLSHEGIVRAKKNKI